MYLQFLRDTTRECSHMFRIWLGPIQPVIIVNHPDTVRALINANPPKARRLVMGCLPLYRLQRHDFYVQCAAVGVAASANTHP